MLMFGSLLLAFDSALEYYSVFLRMVLLSEIYIVSSKLILFDLAKPSFVIAFPSSFLVERGFSAV